MIFLSSWKGCFCFHCRQIFQWSSSGTADARSLYSAEPLDFYRSLQAPSVSSFPAQTLYFLTWYSYPWFWSHFPYSRRWQPEVLFRSWRNATLLLSWSESWSFSWGWDLDIKESTWEDFHEFDIFLFHCGVPVVLDWVVGSSWEHFGHLSPLVSVRSMSQEEDPLFMGHPLDLEDAGVEVVVPTFSALFPKSPLNKLSDEGPPLRPILFN